MNIRRRFRELAALIVSEKAMLGRAEDRYKVNRRKGFVAHNRQRHCEELARKHMHAGHRELAHREMERARHFGATAQAAHGRAQYWFAEVRHVANKLHTLEVQEGKLKPELDKTKVMFDSVTVSEIPKDAPAAAGYVGGLYPTWDSIVADFPKAKHVSIAISAAEEAMMADVENGDLTPYEFPAWVHREKHAHRDRKPYGYGSVSAWSEMLDLCKQHGIQRSDIIVGTAHYTGEPHICGPHSCGELPFDADGTQYTSAFGGRNLDAWHLRTGFIQG